MAGGGSLTADQQTRATNHCTRVSDRIDGELGSKWTTPFGSPYPKLVVDATILIATARYLRAEYRNQPQVEAMEARAAEYNEEGWDIIKRILADPSLLAAESSAVLRDSSQAIGPQMRVSSAPASITLQDSAAWRQPVPDSSFGDRGTPTEYP